MAGTDYFDSVPSDVTFDIEVGTGVFADVTDYVDRESISLRRAKPGEPALLTFNMEAAGGGLTVLMEADVRLSDKSASVGPYTRYFLGRIKEINKSINGANELVYQIVCKGIDQLFKEPPYQLTVTYRVGYAPWEPEHPYIVGDYIQPIPTNGHRYKCIVPGTSGSSQPAWPTIAGSTVDDTSPRTVTWQEDGSAFVTDVTVLNDLLPLFFGNTVDLTGINNLMASVPYMEFPAGTTVEKCLQDIAASAVSNTYWYTYPSFQANTVYQRGTAIEPTTVNGHVYVVFNTTGNAQSGTEPAWPTTSGAYVTSGNVTFRENGLIGRYINSFAYVAGQVFEPTPISNGFYYTCLNNGTTAASPPTFSTVIGTIQTSGTLAFVCSGPTSVLPSYQMSYPADNTPHTAGWKPVFSWFNLNDSTQVPTATPGYSDDDLFDGSVIQADNWEMAQSNSETANIAYVYGAFGSQAIVEDTTRIQSELNKRRAIIIQNDELKSNGDCEAEGRNTLARLKTRETLRVSAKGLPDPVAMRGLRRAPFTNALFGISAKIYPLVDIVMNFPDNIAQYTIEAGDSFLSSTMDVRQATLGGPATLHDTVPPAKPTFGSDWILINEYDPDGQSVTFSCQCQSGREADLDHFNWFARVSGENYMRPLGTTYFPTQHIVASGLPTAIEGSRLITVYVLAVDSNGNFLRDANGQPDYGISPTVALAAPVIYHAPANPDFEILDRVNVTRPWAWPATVVGSATVASTTDSAQGERAVALTSPDTSSPAKIHSIYYRVQTNRVYQATWKHKWDQTITVFVRVYWYDRTKTPISPAYTEIEISGAAVVNYTSRLQFYVPPSGAYFARIEWSVTPFLPPEPPESPLATVVYKLDSVVWEEVTDRVRLPFNSYGANTTLSATDFAVGADTSGGSKTFTLPAAADGDAANRQYYIKNLFGNSLVIAPAGGDTIDGASSLTLANQGQAVVLQSDGGNKWNVYATIGFSLPKFAATAGIATPIIETTVATKTANFTADATASTYLCNTGGIGGSPFTANLPAAASCTGRIYTFKKVDAGTSKVTIDGNGAETIDGIATFPLVEFNQSVTIQSDGSGWRIIEQAGLILTSDGTQWLGPREVRDMRKDGSTDFNTYSANTNLPWTLTMLEQASYKIEKVTWLVQPLTTNNGTSYWNLLLNIYNSSYGGANVNTANTSALTAGTRRPVTALVNAVYDFSAGQNISLWGQVQKNNTPGNLEVYGVTVVVRQVYS